MSTPYLLSGNVDRTQELVAIEAEIEELRSRNIELESEIQKVRRDNARAIAGLRRMLTPFRNAILQIFGEMDAITGPDEPQQQGTNANAKWDAVKARLAPRLREAVDILLIQGTMRRKQIAAAMKMDYTNCTRKT